MKQPLLFFLAFVLFACSKEQKQATKPTPAALTFQQASNYRDTGKKDSAFFYFSRAKDHYLQSKDNVGAGVSMVNMGIISIDFGDLFGGQELALEAVPYFDESNAAHGPYLLSNYNNLGIASYNLRQYPKAVEFYQKSLEFITDSAYARIIKNNIANAYRKEGDYKKAIAVYQTALDGEKDSLNYARIFSNQAYTRWLADPSHNSGTELRNSLSIRVRENDSWGQNSSYAQLADYYKKSQPDSSLIFSQKMFEVATTLGSADDQVEALQKLIPLSSAEDSKRYFGKYQQLSDSLQTLRNNAKNQFVLIRYETEKHKAENLQLQKENAVRVFWIISLAVLLLAGSAIAVLWYRKRKQRLELEAKNAIREIQLQTSKKVHDVVANGLYRLMSEIENNKDFNTDMMLDGMEVLYEQSRDISYEHEDISDADFEDVIKQLFRSFGTIDTKVALVGNNRETWEGVPANVKHELKHILQELMVNMKKHSQAKAVAVRFNKENDEIQVWYTDNGVGISAETVHGNGLTNTGNRIKGMGGTVNFDAGTEGGLTIHLKIPGVH